MSTRIIKNEKISRFANLIAMTRRLLQTITRFKKVIIPVSLVIVITIGIIVHAANISSPSYALTSKCTLSILTGSANVITAGNCNVQPGTDGMTLNAGDRVKSLPDSTALLTFFDGSTLALESDTDIEIEQLELGDNQQTITILLKQWTGKTWSHVVKMVDRGSHYEIKTPSAVALVRGTQFLTEVDEVGATKVLTVEGLVSVSAQGEEIFLPVGQQTEVDPGTPPSDPKPVDISEYVQTQTKIQNRIILSQLEQINNALGSIRDNEGNQDNDIDGQQPIATAQNEEDIQDNENSNGNGNNQNQATGNSQDKDTNHNNSNNNEKDNNQSQGKANDQSTSNSNGNGQGNGNANNQSNSNGQGNGDANNQSNSTSQGNGNANNQSNSNSQGNGNANNQSNSNGQGKGNT